MILFLICGVSVLLRCSELGNEETVAACRMAVWIAGLSGLVGLIPVFKSWGGSGLRVLVGVSIGAVVRFVIGLGGIAVILRFTVISPDWLIVFFVLSYSLFLLAETAISVWLLRTVTWDK